MKIAMTGIHVIDPIAAFNFYTEILGFKEFLFMPDHNLAIVVSKDQPNGTALLLEPSDNPIGKSYMDALYKEGLSAIVLGVDDVEREYSRLVDLGVSFKKKPTKTDWGMKAIFDDSCGNYIQIHQS